MPSCRFLLRLWMPYYEHKGWLKHVAFWDHVHSTVQNRLRAVSGSARIASTATAGGVYTMHDSDALTDLTLFM